MRIFSKIWKFPELIFRQLAIKMVLLSVLLEYSHKEAHGPQLPDRRGPISQKVSTEFKRIRNFVILWH